MGTCPEYVERGPNVQTITDGVLIPLIILLLPLALMNAFEIKLYGVSHEIHTNQNVCKEIDIELWVIGCGERFPKKQQKL